MQWSRKYVVNHIIKSLQIYKMPENQELLGL